MVPCHKQFSVAIFSYSAHDYTKTSINKTGSGHSIKSDTKSKQIQHPPEHYVTTRVENNNGNRTHCNLYYFIFNRIKKINFTYCLQKIIYMLCSVLL